MAFDGITLKSVINELQTLKNGKVDHIYEPNSNEILVHIYNGQKYMIDIDVSANNYRLNITTNTKPNPSEAPNFCMVLRKHLLGSHIQNIRMNGLERICYIDFDCFNEFNEPITKTLVIELMGKYSNVILLNDKGIIIDALKRYNEIDKERNIIPSKMYIIPSQSKVEITDLSDTEFVNEIMNSNSKSLVDAVSNTINGISKVFVKSTIEEIHLSNTVSEKSIKEIYKYVNFIIDGNSKADKFENGYTIYGTDDPEKNDFQVNFFLDDFYTSKVSNETYMNYRNNILKLLEGTLNKLSKKMDNINSKIDSCKDIEKYKIYGELILANIYKYNNIQNGISEIEVENFYSDNDLIKIELNDSISLSKNAEKYFKKYNKMKNTLEIVEKQKVETNKELRYLESVVQEIDNCSSIEDIDDVYNELSENILFNDLKIKQKKSEKIKKKDIPTLSNYIKIKIDDYDVCIGKNNKQNDYLTLKVANENDIWFHTKDIHGSHLILRSNGNTPKISTITKCAQLCAYYSKAKFSSHVPVDYTFVKFVKKPRGAVPGYVIYTNNKTIYVNPQSFI